jgi:hypothetical protein
MKRNPVRDFAYYSTIHNMWQVALPLWYV